MFKSRCCMNLVSAGKSGVSTAYSARSFSSATRHAPRPSSRIRYLIIVMPITAFALGTWQVQRRQWKLDLIDEVEEKLRRPALASLNEIDPLLQQPAEAGDAVPVQLRGTFQHDREMLVGPRQRDGQTGYHVVTPFRELETQRGLLVNRGWISKTLARQQDRPAGLPQSTTSIFGLLRRTTNKNLFTPANNDVKGQYYYVDIEQMSAHTGCEPILVEETIDASYATDDLEEQGIPVGKPHEVLLRNNHMQYIVTWYALALATSAMSVSLFRKAPTTAFTRARRSAS
ncbi:SURF1 family-domain-containing protein [Protomyces lactucae-debilis]|uniref:SURF1-like protein n=1 Tax=Protomyces lactucae-debilis TaxID=2754530 RepID=A0A1Y2FNE5_PROLT|nr:SURF1 family-domain-containing protein [Protomyces lactucae-debilis]ORY84864.1 SURF1 family-domain-containing protein [Protomyces lactucae-debilis]